MELTGIDFLGLDRVLKRGTGEIIARTDHALMIRDSVSGAMMLGCEDALEGAELLERHVDRDCRLLTVTDHGLGLAAYRRYGFDGLLECCQTAYYGKPPQAECKIALRQAGEGDLPLLIKTYDLVSPEELALIVDRGRLLLGCDRDQTVGFIGEHLEGSMGLLYVFPEHRRKGYAAALETAFISRTLAEGFIPFGQVEKSNLASLALQRKLGMTLSDNLICWMWK